MPPNDHFLLLKIQCLSLVSQCETKKILKKKTLHFFRFVYRCKFSSFLQCHDASSKYVPWCDFHPRERPGHVIFISSKAETSLRRYFHLEHASWPNDVRGRNKRRNSFHDWWMIFRSLTFKFRISSQLSLNFCCGYAKMA